MNREEYLGYLRSEEWCEKRKEFLEDENYECEECGEKAKEVHHINYGSLGDEEREDVMVLCKECHEDKHSEDGKDVYGEYD